MSTTLTTGKTTVPTILSGAPDGVIRVFTSGRPTDVDMPDVRKVARSAAQRHHGFGSVGSNPVPVPAKFRDVAGLAWDFTPVTSRRAVDATPAAPAPAPRKGKGKGRKGSADAAAMLRKVLAGDLDPSEALAALATLAGTTAPTGKGKGKSAPAKDRPAFLGKRDDATCETCQDYGVVRKAGSRAGGAYKTQGGADTATANGNAVPCPTHKTARSGKRKTA